MRYDQVGTPPWKKLFPPPVRGQCGAASITGSTRGGSKYLWGQDHRCHQQFALDWTVERAPCLAAPLPQSLAPVPSLPLLPWAKIRRGNSKASR